MAAMAFALIAVLVAPSARAQSCYVNPAKGDDAAAGTQAAPFKTVDRALKQLDGVGGEMHLSPDAGFYRQTIQVRKGGTADHPLVIDGHGAIVNLGVDITAGPWTKADAIDPNAYVLDRALPFTNSRVHVASFVFVNGFPLYADHPKGKAPKAAHGGSAFYDDAGKLVVVFPRGLTPENSVIVWPGGADFMACGFQLSSASHVVIRNVTACFAPNDGFNFHGKGSDVTVENVRGIFNGDQGISSHETYEVVARDSEFAFDGSQGGGIVDIGDANTSYINCRLHQNRSGAFNLQGSKHRVEKCVSYGNGGQNLPKATEKVAVVDSIDRGKLIDDVPVPVIDGKPTKATTKPGDESDRLGRFLALRP